MSPKKKGNFILFYTARQDNITIKRKMYILQIFHIHKLDQEEKSTLSPQNISEGMILAH